MPRGDSDTVEPTAIERAMARRVAESRATVPDLELGVQVAMDGALAIAEAHGVSTTAVLVQACALALRETPRANAAYRDGRFELFSRVNVAVVRDGERGPVAPTVFDADGKGLEQLEQELTELAGRAERGELSAPELSGGTFTLFDLGPYGVDRPGIVIPGGQAAALAAGSIRATPVVRGGAIVPGQTMQLTLAADHRILYGARAAGFVTLIKTLLENQTP